MSDQTTPPALAEDANNSADAGTGTQEEQDFRALYEQEKQRADNLQPEFTRATQELAQQRQAIEALQSDDPVAQAWAAQVLGVALEDAEPQDNQIGDDLDPRTAQEIAALRQELQTIQESLSTRDNQAAEEQFKSSVIAGLDDYPEGLRGLAADLALIQAKDTGSFDIDAVKASIAEMAPAWASLPDVQTAVKKGWEQTKTAPRITQAGTAGTNTPNLDDMTTAERHEHMAQRLIDLNASQ